MLSRVVLQLKKGEMSSFLMVFLFSFFVGGPLFSMTHFFLFLSKKGGGEAGAEPCKAQS